MRREIAIVIKQWWEIFRDIILYVNLLEGINNIIIRGDYN